MRSYFARLFAVLTLVSLLAGCAGGPDQWQEWISDLLGGPAPTVEAPPTPGLAPTPTLSTAPGGQPAATAGQPVLPPQATEETLPATPVPDEFGPFTGTFEGVMVGDNDSSAPLQLELVQRGRQIEGTATLGDGLIVRAGGVCGSFPIPAITLSAADELDQVDARRLSTSTNVDVSGFEIPVELEAELGPDGNTVTAEATMYPPALCGTNPTVSATLTRVE